MVQAGVVHAGVVHTGVVAAAAHYLPGGSTPRPAAAPVPTDRASAGAAVPAGARGCVGVCVCVFRGCVTRASFQGVGGWWGATGGS